MRKSLAVKINDEKDNDDDGSCSCSCRMSPCVQFEGKRSKFEAVAAVKQRFPAKKVMMKGMMIKWPLLIP